MTVSLSARPRCRPGKPIRPQSIARLSSQSLNPSQTDKTSSKLTKTVHSNPTISLKMLNFLPISAPEEKFSDQLSLEPINRSPRQPTQVRTSQQGRPLPNNIEQIRTRGMPNRRGCVLPSTDKSTPKPAKIDQNCAPQSDDLLRNTGFPRDLRRQEKMTAETPSAYSQSLAHDPPSADPPGLNRSAAQSPRR